MRSRPISNSTCDNTNPIKIVKRPTHDQAKHSVHTISLCTHITSPPPQWVTLTQFTL